MKLSRKDRAYWIWKEKDVIRTLVDLRDYGFPVFDKEVRYKNMPRSLIRPEVAEALVRARKLLPKGYNFKIDDGWRPWALQKIIVHRVRNEIRQAHPDWSAKMVEAHLEKMAPSTRVIPKLASHRYGGAIDLTVVDLKGVELNMGVRVNYVEGPESNLLYYEFKNKLSFAERTYKKNRRILINAMVGAGFEPYVLEFWHWGYRG